MSENRLNVHEVSAVDYLTNILAGDRHVHPLYLENDSACGHHYVQWKTNRNSYAIYQMMPFVVTLSDPEPRSRKQYKVETVEY